MANNRGTHGRELGRSYLGVSLIATDIHFESDTPSLPNDKPGHALHHVSIRTSDILAPKNIPVAGGLDGKISAPLAHFAKSLRRHSRAVTPGLRLRDSLRDATASGPRSRLYVKHT